MGHGNIKKPRILLLSTAYAPLVGGSELAIRNLTDRMLEYDFDMVTGRYSPDAPVMEVVGRIRVFRAGGRWHGASFVFPKLLMPLAIFFTAWRLARTHEYILVHAWQASQAAGAGWLLKKFRPQLPFLVTVQEGKELGRQSWPVRRARAVILRSADAVSVISEYLAEYVRSLVSVPVYVLPNGVSLERFIGRPAPEVLTRAHEHMRVGPHDRVIISVSRLVPKNGIANLIRALPLVRDRLVHDDVVLVVVGGGELLGELKHVALLERVSDHVRFIGHVEHGDLPAYLHSAHVFARPSVSEGLGSAFLEAMAAGVPVVASTVGGIADFLKDGETGFVCDPGDPASIARVLISALSGGPDVSRVRENALAMVRERYSWDTIAASMGDVYRKTVHGTTSS